MLYYAADHENSLNTTFALNTSAFWCTAVGFVPKFSEHVCIYCFHGCCCLRIFSSANLAGRGGTQTWSYHPYKDIFSKINIFAQFLGNRRMFTFFHGYRCYNIRMSLNMLEYNPAGRGTTANWNSDVREFFDNRIPQRWIGLTGFDNSVEYPCPSPLPPRITEPLSVRFLLLTVSKRSRLSASLFSRISRTRNAHNSDRESSRSRHIRETLGGIRLPFTHMSRVWNGLKTFNFVCLLFVPLIRHVDFFLRWTI